MITKIIAWILIVTGAYFLVKPETLKNKFQKKFYKKARYVLLTLSFTGGFYFISFSFKYHGIAPKIITLFGIFAIFKSFLLLRSKAYEKIMEILSSSPLWAFRVAAIFYAGIGLLMLLGLRK